MVEYLPNREPQFLLYGPRTPDCKLVPESLNKYYTITIPELFPHEVFHGVASFSSPPTSPDCVVCAWCETYDDGKIKAECWEPCRNATKWAMRDTTSSRLTNMIGAVYHNESFCFCNDEDHVLKFDIRNGSLSRPYSIRNTTETKPGIKCVPWRRRIVGTDGVKGVLGLAEELIY
ncbi:hypothetical protein SLEP1_g23246 [Rubroshorea leprosula]|uniref:Uncharacterized protein n=1 Tax=Rubroshorea leprosula TaxID=152421 RepID=A0AAV5JET3_9ROSI|nr:hypothetical protein SLEP1_g23246 [Rubroshorea leprosula]